MEIRAFTCPQCGAPIEVPSTEVNIVRCPHCGCDIHISYGEGENAPGTREFKAPDGTVIATAVVPATYELEARINEGWQSELIPFTTRIRANSGDGIILVSDSKELFHDVRNPFINGIIALVPVHTKNGYRSFVDPDEYLAQWAASLINVKLEALAKAKLPSFMGTHPEAARSQLENDITVFDRFMEISTSRKNLLCNSYMIRFEGVLENGSKCTVLAGMDYEGAELVYGGDFLKGLNGIKGLADSKYVRELREKLKLGTGSTGLSDFVSATSDVLTGRDKLTMSDLMSGGLIGKARRRRQEAEKQEPAAPVQKEEESSEPKAFGSGGQRTDQITFGSYRRYMCMYTEEKESEAPGVFLDFVRSVVPGQTLAQKEADAVNAKMAQIRQVVAQNQAIVAREQARLRSMQMQTSQMIARNSQIASAGLMDSFEKKMASDSRISQGRSEAIMGTDTYENSYGQSVSVSVAADHVYEDRYGEVYGVSGTAPGSDVLASLEWKEIEKK